MNFTDISSKLLQKLPLESADVTQDKAAINMLTEGLWGCRIARNQHKSGKLAINTVIAALKIAVAIAHHIVNHVGKSPEVSPLIEYVAAVITALVKELKVTLLLTLTHSLTHSLIQVVALAMSMSILALTMLLLRDTESNLADCNTTLQRPWD